MIGGVASHATSFSRSAKRLVLGWLAELNGHVEELIVAKDANIDPIAVNTSSFEILAERVGSPAVDIQDDVSRLETDGRRWRSRETLLEEQAARGWGEDKNVFGRFQKPLPELYVEARPVSK